MLIKYIKMKIGIEAHTIEKTEKLGAGGNYLTGLLKEWSKLDPNKYKFILYFKERIPKDKFLNSKVFIKKIVKIPFGIKSTALFYNVFFPLNAKKDKLDILFLPFYMRPFFCFSPIITAIHDISFKKHPEWFAWNYKIPFQLLTKLAIKKSKAILVCSEYTKKEIIENYKINPKKIKLIYLAVDKKFKNEKEKSRIKKIKEKYGLNKKYIFYTGTIFNRRHVLESIKAFEKNLKDGLDCQFLISGRDFTKPTQDIDKKIERINENFPEAIKKIKFIDYNDLIFVYQGAEIFIWLSNYEGFGLPVLEAMSCGTPVLTTKKSSLSEVLGNYPLCVENPKDIKEIFKKIKMLFQNQEIKKESIKKGLIQAQKFSWEKTAEETLKILEKYANEE